MRLSQFKIKTAALHHEKLARKVRIMIWLALLAALSTLLYFYLKNANNYWKKFGVKQTKPLLFFGDGIGTFLQTQSFCGFLEDLYNLHPGTRYTGFYQFGKPVLLLRDPELIKQITIKDFDHFVDHQPFVSEDADPLMGRNLFSLRGKQWRDMRTTLSPLFTSSKMRYMFTFINETAKSFADYFLNEHNEETIEIEMKDTFTRYTNDVIATSAFGISVDSLRDKNNDFYLHGKDAVNFTSPLKTIKLLLYFLSPTLSKWLGMTMLGEKVNAFFTNLVFDSMKQREEKNIVRTDVIHLLMEAKKGNLKPDESDEQDGDLKNSTKTQITDIDIAAQALVFFFAGFDSVSALMCFMAYELAINADVQARLRAEITDHDGPITYEAILQMKYLDMVISETLRKYPNAVGTDRLCTKPYTIQPKTPDERPVHLREGDQVWISAIGMQRDPELFPDPDRFDPERFSDENKKNINPYAYIPFGIGPRICIGSRFALLETKLIFYYVLRHFEITLSPKMIHPVQINEKEFTMGAKGGFWLNFNKLNGK